MFSLYYAESYSFRCFVLHFSSKHSQVPDIHSCNKTRCSKDRLPGFWPVVDKLYWCYIGCSLHASGGCLLKPTNEVWEIYVMFNYLSDLIDYFKQINEVTKTCHSESNLLILVKKLFSGFQAQLDDPNSQHLGLHFNFPGLISDALF